MPELFMVIATQNPVEQEGTYPLPEVEMDWFLIHVFIDYPTHKGVYGREGQPAGKNTRLSPIH